MLGTGQRRRARRVILIFAGVIVGAASLGASLDADPDRGGRAAGCGAAAVTTVAQVDGAVARRIYEAETHGAEVTADVNHVTGSAALLSALAGGGEAAVQSAVHAIVYHPRWHIVRLRVLRAGHVLADVGGPDVIAPVSGPLRAGGRTLGSYVLSVQDDAGYIKLVSRFIGVPVDLYRNGAFVMGTLQPAPPPPGQGAPVTIGADRYRTRLLSTRAFPSGPLQVALFLASPSPGVASSSCAAVRLGAWGNVAMHIAGRFKPLTGHYQDLADILRGATGGPALVSSGSQPIAGDRAVSHVPARGLVSYGGHRWAVFSWEPAPGVRVYSLTPTG